MMTTKMRNNVYTRSQKLYETIKTYQTELWLNDHETIYTFSDLFKSKIEVWGEGWTMNITVGARTIMASVTNIETLEHTVYVYGKKDYHKIIILIDGLVNHYHEGM